MAHRSVEFTNQELDELVLKELAEVINHGATYTWIDLELETLPTKVVKSLKAREDLLNLDVDHIDVVASLNRLHTSGKISLAFAHSREYQKTGWFSKGWVSRCLIRIKLIQEESEKNISQACIDAKCSAPLTTLQD